MKSLNADILLKKKSVDAGKGGLKALDLKAVKKCCPVCNAEFKVKSSTSGRSKDYCSSACQRINYAGKQRQKRGSIEKYANCIYCQKPLPVRRSPRRKYCDDKCCWKYHNHINKEKRLLKS